MYKEKWKNYYFERKYLHLPSKWNLLRAVAKDTLTTNAQERLEWIIFYLTVGRKNARLTAEHFSISRKTFHKWLGRFDERKLKNLEDQSRAPRKVRDWMVTRQEEAKIVSLRKENIELGKKKLQRIYQLQYGEYISTWKIERVIRKYQLYPDLTKHKKAVARRKLSRHKVRIHEVQSQLRDIKAFGLLWHIDSIVIWWYGKRKVIFTAIEDTTRIAFARIYHTNTSGYAEDFLKRLMYLTDGRIQVMHQDNGSEFKGVFEESCQKMGISQVYSRPYTPKDNATLERFNRTIQEEWLDLSEVGLDDIREANENLTLWLVKYNSFRPHQALDYQTPLEYAHNQFPELLPMYPAHTSI